MAIADVKNVPNGNVKLDFTTFCNVIDGRLEKTEITRHNINPSTLEANPEVPVATIEDVDKAVVAAKRALEVWSNTPLDERKQALLLYADALDLHKEDFAVMLVKEQGSPISAARFLIENSAAMLRKLVTLPFTEHVIEESENRSVVTQYVPVGVSAGLIPWNFPVNLMTIKLVQSLIAGSPIIIKPSPFTPYCNLKLAELAQQFFPPGVVQALSGDDRLGPWLTEHPQVDKVSFTGSSATGKKVMESCSKTLKRVTLELGGNDPAIVCADVDIAAVAPKITFMALLATGQMCLAIKRVYVHASIYDGFIEAMKNFAKTLVFADGFKEGAWAGPVQNSLQFERVKNLLADIEKEKLKIVWGDPSSAAVGDSLGKGYFVAPVIVDNPPEASRIVVEEPFGPIFPVLKWTDETDVLRRANNTHMGLGASVWTNNMEQADRMAKQLQAGTVWINSHMEAQFNAPFGGHKQSGLGSELGIEGIRAYCNVKTVFRNKPKVA